jgi:hypothetical protein
MELAMIHFLLKINHDLEPTQFLNVPVMLDLYIDLFLTLQQHIRTTDKSRVIGSPSQFFISHKDA